MCTMAALRSYNAGEGVGVSAPNLMDRFRSTKWGRVATQKRKDYPIFCKLGILYYFCEVLGVAQSIVACHTALKKGKVP